MKIKLVIPWHLRNLASVQGEIDLEVEEPLTIARALDALEECYPVLRGTVRDHDSRKRRPFIRFFACEQDMSHCPTDTELPSAVRMGEEPLLIVGAMAGG